MPMTATAVTRSETMTSTMVKPPCERGLLVKPACERGRLTRSWARLPLPPRIRASSRAVDHHARGMGVRRIGHEHRAARARAIRAEVDHEVDAGILRYRRTGAGVHGGRRVP